MPTTLPLPRQRDYSCVGASFGTFLTVWHLMARRVRVWLNRGVCTCSGVQLTISFPRTLTRTHRAILHYSVEDKLFTPLIALHYPFTDISIHYCLRRCRDTTLPRACFATGSLQLFTVITSPFIFARTLATWRIAAVATVVGHARWFVARTMAPVSCRCAHLLRYRAAPYLCAAQPSPPADVCQRTPGSYLAGVFR